MVGIYGSRVVYELDYKNPVLYVIPIQSILGKLPVVPVGDTCTILYHLRNTFSGAPGDRRKVLAMDARCGSSTRGLWVGRGTCNESSGVTARGNAWRNVPCDLNA